MIAPTNSLGKQYYYQSMMERFISKFRRLRGKISESESNDTYWSRPENYKVEWDARAAMAARLIKPNELKICDVGCGANFALLKFLSNQTSYFPVDIHQWTQDVSYCDLNKGIIPSKLLEDCDVTFLLGVFEYIYDINSGFKMLQKHCKTLIVSYCSVDFEKGRWEKWVNGLTGVEFHDALINAGYEIEWWVVYKPGIYIFRANRA